MFTNIHVLSRTKILNGLLAMHLRGFNHNDFEEKHVVGGSQGYRITGLYHISENHQCSWDSERDNWNVGEYCSEDFPCNGLKNAGDRMNIWRKGNYFPVTPLNIY